MHSKKAIFLTAILAFGSGLLLGSLMKSHHHPGSVDKIFFRDSVQEIDEQFINVWKEELRPIGEPFEHGWKEEIKTNNADYVFYRTTPVRGTAFENIYCFEQIEQEPGTNQRWMFRGTYFVNALTYSNGVYWLSKPIFTSDGSSVKISIAGKTLHEISSYAAWRKDLILQGSTNVR